jgi:hypothetical protein
VENLLDDEESALFGARTWGQTFKALKNEYHRAKQSSYDTGHTFDTAAKYLHVNPSRITAVAADPRYRYVGGVIAQPTYYQTLGGAYTYWPSVPSFSEAYYGPKAISATMPTHPLAGLAVTLAELKREGIPALVGQTVLGRPKYSRPRSRGAAAREIRRGAQNSGREYLNYEFGYKPLGSDLGAAAAAAAEAGSILSLYQRNSGKLIHATHTFPPEDSTTVYPTRSGKVYTPSPTTAVSDGIWVGGSSGRWGTQLEEVTSSRRVYFRGAYTYHLQQAGSLFDKAKRYEQEGNRLLGLRVGPDVAWALTPWSWLVDWHVNIGDNISNATALANDGLVLQYGYLMVEDRLEHRIVIQGPRTLSGHSGPWLTTFSVVSKRRFKATPYGFARNPTSFTSRQWAILGALGLTKAPGILR